MGEIEGGKEDTIFSQVEVTIPKSSKISLSFVACRGAGRGSMEKAYSHPGGKKGRSRVDISINTCGSVEIPV